MIGSIVSQRIELDPRDRAVAPALNLQHQGRNGANIRTCRPSPSPLKVITGLD
jgi:hypothetical protein